MKRILLTFMAAIALVSVNAQNLNKIKDALTANKLGEAKTAVEALLASPKNQKNPEIYYLKGKVLSAIAANPAERAAMPESRMQSLESFKKALEIDKNQTTLFLTVDNYQPVFSLYSSGFEEGAAYYNGEKFEDALTTFKSTGVIGDYIFSQGWGLYKLDTTLTYYMGLSALNAKKEDEAISLFKKLADANVGGTSDMATPYRYLAKYYYDKKDEANMNNYIGLGLKIFPKDDYLPLLALDHVREKNNTGEVLKTYEKLLSINPESFDITYEYASEIFGITHNPTQFKVNIGQTKETVLKILGQPTKISKTKTSNIETELLIYESQQMEVGIDVTTGKVTYIHELNKPWLDTLGTYEEKCSLIEKLYRKSLEINPSSIEAEISLGKHLYNQTIYYDENLSKIKGTKPEDIQRKESIQKQINSISEKAIISLEKVFNRFDTAVSMKLTDKSNYKTASTLLNYIYTQSKNVAKASFYQKKYDEADKKILIGDNKDAVIEKLGQPSSVSSTTTEQIKIELLIYNSQKIEIGINSKTNRVIYIHQIK